MLIFQWVSFRSLRFAACFAFSSSLAISHLNAAWNLEQVSSFGHDRSLHVTLIFLFGFRNIYGTYIRKIYTVYAMYSHINSFLSYPEKNSLVRFDLFYSRIRKKGNVLRLHPLDGASILLHLMQAESKLLQESYEMEKS